MPDKRNRVRILPDSLVNVIAAGEVVERPASVVKELIENALDAGACRISVRLGDGGRSLIQVQDDGQGMSRDDAVLAVERHATSKIASVEDLEALTTLGFRGEALPSIAAVGRFVLETWDGQGGGGTRVVMDFGRLVSVEPHPRARGTTAALTGLFSKLPARRKFLRSADTERTWCIRAVEDAALARPEVHFEVADEDGSVLLLPGVSALRDRLTSLWGGEAVGGMIALRGSGPGVDLEGYVSAPSLTYPRRLRHHVMINGRPVRDPAVNRLIAEALGGSYPSGRFPALVLSVLMDPGSLDANVHPSKREVRLRQPAVFSAALKEAVGSLSAGPVRPSPARPGSTYRGPDRAADRPGASSYGLGLPGVAAAAARETALPLPDEGWQVAGQLLGTYILATGPDGLMVVDQHAAHERILYNRLMRAFESGDRPSQALLEPRVLSLSPAESANLRSRSEALGRFGFAVEEFGGAEVRLSALPAEVPSDRSEDLLRILASDLEGGTGTPAELALSISRWACHASVRAGRSLSFTEMAVLLRQLREAESGFACPHGRPTSAVLDRVSLEKLFSRR